MNAKNVYLVCWGHSISRIASNSSLRSTLKAIICSPFKYCSVFKVLVFVRCLCTKNVHVICVVFVCYTYSLSAKTITTWYLQSIQCVDTLVVWRLTRYIKLSVTHHSSRCTHRRFQFCGSTCWRRWRRRRKIRRKRWKIKGIQSKPHKIQSPVTQSLNPECPL
jgi:hypothetical protein